MMSSTLFSGSKTFVFEPTLSNTEQVKTLLKTIDSECIHPLDNNLIVKDKISFKIVKNELDSESFKSSMKMKEMESIQYEMMKKYHQLNEIINYPPVILFPGNTGSVHLRDDFNIITVTKKTHTYFDLVAYYLDKDNVLKSCDYSSRIRHGLTHSGDIGNLLHTIKCDDKVSKFLLGVVGFSNSKLHSFIEQNPIITIIDNDKIMIVPCPLDKASVGDATFSGLVCCRIENDRLIYKILDKPLILENIIGIPVQKCTGAI